MRRRPQPTVGHAGPPSAQAGRDVELIDAVVAAVETTQGRRDADAFAALLTPEAVWVTAFGRRLTGWQEIQDFTRSVLVPGVLDQLAHYDTEHITFLADTVAVVNVRQRPVDGTGQPLAGQGEGRPLYVMRKEQGSWRIAAGQNTKHQEAEIAVQQQAIERRA